MHRGRSVSVLSDSSDLDFDGTVKAELEKLQRQFRMMERDRQSNRIQSQDVLRKQRHEISKLREEQEELLRALNVRESQYRRQSENHDTEKIQTMLEQQNMLDDQLESERQTQAQLEQEISNMEKKLVEARRGEIMTSQGHTTQVLHTKKAIQTVQNKLDRARIRFSEQMTKNSQLRDELETLRMQHVRFKQLHQRLEKLLQDIRKDIGEVIDKSTTAYDAREEAQTKMTTMKAKAIKDLAQYSAEMKELERVIAHNRKLREFMATKSNERTTLDDGQEIRFRHEMKEKRRAGVREETSDNLKEDFQQLRKVTGEDDLNMLVTKIRQGKDRNMSLLDFVNDQKREAEKLKKEMRQIGKEMEQLRMAGLQSKQNNQAVVEQMKDEMQECETQNQQYEAQAENICRILDQIKTGIDEMFNEMECECALEDGMLGSRITDSNIYLSKVEEKISDLLTIYAFVKSKDIENSYDLKEVTPLLLGQKLDVQGDASIVQHHLTRQDYGAEASLTDEDDRPLNNKELLQCLMRSSVVRKESSLSTAGGKDVKTPKSNTISSSRQRSRKSDYNM